MNRNGHDDIDPERLRLAEDARRGRNWKRWGPYLSERQWGTVREDYSADGDCWRSVTHDAARSLAYRWGEDGMLGFTDRECRLCLAVALWNGRDPILKERLFGLVNDEGNHGEDVKEIYHYLDATPTHSYNRALYRYPLDAFPYGRLVEGNRARGAEERELELADTGVLDGDRFVDVVAEYAKDGPDEIHLLLTLHNRSDRAATLHVLPTAWFRNTWSWGDGSPRPTMRADGTRSLLCDHPTLGAFRVEFAGEGLRELLFTENETNAERLFDAPSASPWTKDAFHRRVVGGEAGATNPAREGTKACAWFVAEIPARGTRVLRVRLAPADAPARPLDAEAFDAVVRARRAEADRFYAPVLSAGLPEDDRRIARQAYAGLLWSKQFYHYAVAEWLDGDPGQPAPPASRRDGRNAAWRHLYNRDILSMPDAWEYPWYAAWDLAFHAVAFAPIDPHFAKEQLLLLLREWYMHPNGQIPAYEFAFDDVNPPVHAWACWRVYKMTGARGERDRAFLARAFQKLLLNFTWWVNRKDPQGRHVFAGGFLGLDNIGVFDRSQPLPFRGREVRLEQADGTAWMAFYCGTMLSIALELAREDPAYEDIASKFFEHFVSIADAMNRLGGDGLWNEADGFYYDHVRVDGTTLPLKVRSMVGLIPLFAAEIVEDDTLRRLPNFTKRMRWFLEHRPELAGQIAYMIGGAGRGERHGHHLLAIPSEDRLRAVLARLLDEGEFLSPHGVRSLSRVHLAEPFRLEVDGRTFVADYTPGESTTRLFGGNSNWRGPIWFPLNHLLVEALERYHHFYGDRLTVEFPAGSGEQVHLGEVARRLRGRLVSIFRRGPDGRRPCLGDDPRQAGPLWTDNLLFHEYFHGETGRGLGASHQTGWTALVALAIGALAPDAEQAAPSRDRREAKVGENPGDHAEAPASNPMDRVGATAPGPLIAAGLPG